MREREGEREREDVKMRRCEEERKREKMCEDVQM